MRLRYNVRLSRHVYDQFFYETFDEVYDLELFTQGIGGAPQKRFHPEDLIWGFKCCGLMSDTSQDIHVFTIVWDTGISKDHTRQHTYMTNTIVQSIDDYALLLASTTTTPALGFLHLMGYKSIGTPMV